MNRALRLAAVVVPLLGLAGLWATSHQTYHEGTEWEVPIQGYDPRDYLRGHYIEFSYDWPGLDEAVDVQRADALPNALCLEGAPPRVATARVMFGGEACAHPVRADAGGVYGWDALMRGRLYLGQDRAQALQEQLQDGDQRGIVTIRQREDGSFTPISIRFRPLTPAEIKQRDDEAAERERAFGPPAIMIDSSGNPPPSPRS